MIITDRWLYYLSCMKCLEKLLYQDDFMDCRKPPGVPSLSIARISETAELRYHYIHLKLNCLESGNSIFIIPKSVWHRVVNAELISELYDFGIIGNIFRIISDSYQHMCNHYGWKTITIRQCREECTTGWYTFFLFVLSSLEWSVPNYWVLPAWC